MDLRRLTLHQLRVFRAVARHRSFTRAARELLLTESAVSSGWVQMGSAPAETKSNKKSVGRAP